jgi:hypothetical protein
VIELTDEIRRAYAEAWYRTVGLDEGSVAGVVAEEVADPMPWREAALKAVLAVVERDLAPTQDAYDAAVRALEKHRTRATIHADTLLKIHVLLDEYRGAKALREGVRTAIEMGALQIDELLGGARSPGGDRD